MLVFGDKNEKSRTGNPNGSSLQHLWGSSLSCSNLGISGPVKPTVAELEFFAPPVEHVACEHKISSDEEIHVS